MDRKHCLISILAMALIIFLIGTQIGCEGKPKKEKASASKESEKMSAEAKKAPGEMAMMPFGGKEDVEFANMAWAAMKGYDKSPITTGMVPGKSPHGKFLTTYYDVISVQGKPYHAIIKDNFTEEKALAAVTVMIQREAGYDADNNDWFWVKYNPDGTIAKNDKGMALAGRVAKGMDTGCIACHKKAGDEDYVFTNDSMDEM